MFERLPKSEIAQLRRSSLEFKEALDRHEELDKECRKPVDDRALKQLKREKLLNKQKLEKLYEQTRMREALPH